jgi:hypothetical protein
MRIRTIKPDFWRSLTLARVTRDQRLLFAGLLNYCDDEGRGMDEPRLIKGDLFPMDDDVTPTIVDAWMAALAAVGHVNRYADDFGRKLFSVRSWKEHQRIDRPQVSKLPAPKPEDSTSVRRTVVEQSSLEGKGREGKGRDRKGTDSVALTRHAGRNGSKALANSFEQIQAHLATVLAEVHAGTRDRLNADELRDTQAELVFAYWQAQLNHRDALFDRKRLSRLRERLRENSGNVHELLYVVDGTLKDQNLMGQNERGRKYDGIETIFRERAQVERLAALGGFAAGREHRMAQKYLGGPSA